MEPAAVRQPCNCCCGDRNSNLRDGPDVGTTLIAVVVQSSANPMSTVKDAPPTASSNCSKRPEFTGSGTVSVWALNTPAGDVNGTPVITATSSSGTPEWSILIQEVQGLATGTTLAALVDGTPGSVNGTTSPLSPTTTTTLGANQYLLGIYGDNGNGATFTKPSNLTLDTNSINTSSTGDCGVAYGNTAGGGEVGSWTITGTIEGGAILLAFKLAAGGTSATVTMSGALAATTAQPAAQAGSLTAPAYAASYDIVAGGTGSG